MNRVIKFRAKNVYNGDWEYGHVRSRINDGWTITDEYGFQCDINEDTIGQFTGFKDKNGNEIYEGDILKGIYGDITCSVAWYKDHFTLVDEDGKSIGGILSYFSRFAIVVGNIYDNTELLNK